MTSWLLTVLSVNPQDVVLLDYRGEIDTFPLKACHAVLRENDLLVLRQPQRLPVVFDHRERLQQITTAHLRE